MNIAKKMVDKKVKKIRLIISIASLLFMAVMIPVLVLVLFAASLIQEDMEVERQLQLLTTQSYMALYPTDTAIKEIPPLMLQTLQEVQDYYDIPWTILAAIAKHKTEFGQDIPRGSYGAYAVSANWWSGWHLFATLKYDPDYNVSNNGWGINEFDIPDNKDEIDSARRHNSSCRSRESKDEDDSFDLDSCLVSVPDPIYTADPEDFRDATFALARHLQMEGFTENPRATLDEYLGLRAVSNAIVAKAEQYGTIVERATMPIEGGYSGLGNQYLRWPVDEPYYISSHFGRRVDPVSGEVGSFHQGIDITGQELIKAVANGLVVFAGEGTPGSGFNGFGYVVAIDHGRDIYTIYAHLKEGSIRVRAGQNVTQGTVLGLMGTTGRSTGVHLHFEMRFYGAKRDNVSIAINPICAYRATSNILDNADQEWTDIISRIGYSRLQSCS